MTKRKSIKKKIIRKRILYRDALGRFVTKAQYIKLHKRPAPSKQKSKKTPVSHIKPTPAIKKKESKTPKAKTPRNKERIVAPPLKKKVKKRKKKLYVLDKIKIVEKPKAVKKKPKKKRKPKEPKPPKGFEIPVEAQLGMYNVSGLRGNTLAQLAVLINDQIQRGAKRFRFWYYSKGTIQSGNIQSGVASTGILSWQLVSTKYKDGIEGFLRKFDGKVFQYWFVIDK